MNAHALARITAVALASGGCLERGTEHKDAPVEPIEPPANGKRAGERAHQPPAGPADPDAEIRVRLEAEPSHLNPLIAGDGLAVRVTLGDVYEGLLCRARPLAPPRPCLAERFEVSADELEWRFWLRNQVRFHDGTLFSSVDAISSIEAVARAKTPTPLTAELDDLVSAQLEEDGALVVSFARRRLDRLGAFARLPILPSERLASAELPVLVAEPISRAPVGTGPLRFVRWLPGESIALARFDGYWGQPAAAARVLYKIVGSRERAFAMARSGKLDVVAQLPVGEARDIAATQDDLDVYIYRRPAYLAAVFNARRSAMDTARERRALTMLLDRRSIIDAILGGEGEPISGPFVGEEIDPSIAPLPFDRDAARSTLDGERVGASLLFPSESKTMARIADIWAADARGVATLSPTPAPYATVLERSRAGEFDVVLLAFTTGAELDMWPRLHSSQVGAENYGAIREPALDRALDDVRGRQSHQSRVDVAHRAHRAIAATVPYAFIASDVRAGLVARRIGGVEEGDGLAARFLWRERSGQRK